MNIIMEIFTPEMPMAFSVFLAQISSFDDAVMAIANIIIRFAYLLAVGCAIYSAYQLVVGNITNCVLGIAGSGLMGAAGLLVSALFEASGNNIPGGF